MKYCLIGLVSAMGLSMGFLSTTNFSNTPSNSVDQTIDVGQSQDAELHVIGFWTV